MSDFKGRRDAVITYVREQMVAHGASEGDAVRNTAAIKLFNPRDVENLYKCITSDLPEGVVASIVAHDFRGLRDRDEHFLPQSTQFEVQ